jgi:hypothetical protein
MGHGACRIADEQAVSMSSVKCTCGKKIADQDAFTVGNDSLCQECYLGATGQGPLSEQFNDCPKCGHLIHKFTAFCPECRVSVREIGKVESVGRGTATKGIAFVVGIVILALASMAVGNYGVQSGRSLVAVIPLGIGAFVLGVNGLLGLLYFRFFVIATFVQGLPGFALGAGSFILSVVLFLLMI